MRPNLLRPLRSALLMLRAWEAQRENMKLGPHPELAECVRDTEAAVTMAEDRGEVQSYRIRHCEGNKAAWCLVRLRPDGSEIDSYGGFTTAMSLDSLLAHAGHLTPKPGDDVEFIP